MKRCWKNWIKAAGIRALKTVAQTAVSTIGTSGIPEECPEEVEGTDAE